MKHPLKLSHYGSTPSVVDAAAFVALMAKVDNLESALAAQQEQNRKLETSLQKALADCGDLRNEIRTLKSREKRTRSLERLADDDPDQKSDASMSSGDKQPLRRKSPSSGRVSPNA